MAQLFVVELGSGQDVRVEVVVQARDAAEARRIAEDEHGLLAIDAVPA